MKHAWLLVLAFACSKKSAEGQPERRDGTAPPVVVVDAPSAGPGTPEVEPNDERAQATPFAVPGRVTGTIGRAGDVDAYRLSLSAASSLRIKLEAPGLDAVVDVVDENGTLLFRSDRGPADVWEGMPNAPVPGPVFVLVKEFIKKGREPRAEASASYSLSVTEHRAKDNEEVELSSAPDPSTPPNMLIAGQESFGYIGWARDEDLWGLPPVPAEGQLLSVSVRGVEQVPLEVAVLRGGEVLVSRKGPRGRGVELRGVPVGDTLRVSSRKSHPGDPYLVSVSYAAPAQGGEAEPNDTMQTAQTLRGAESDTSGTLHGHLDAGDEDWFRLGTALGGLFELRLESPEAGDLRLDVTVLGQTTEVDDTRRGGTEASIVSVPAGQELLFRVSGRTRPEDSRYVLRWSYRPIAE